MKEKKNKGQKNACLKTMLNKIVVTAEYFLSCFKTCLEGSFNDVSCSTGRLNLVQIQRVDRGHFSGVDAVS